MSYKFHGPCTDLLGDLSTMGYVVQLADASVRFYREEDGTLVMTFTTSAKTRPAVLARLKEIGEIADDGEKIRAVEALPDEFGREQTGVLK